MLPGTKRKYTVRTRHLEPGCHTEIGIGLYYPDGTTAGEFAVRWLELPGGIAPRLEVFDDAWGVLLLHFSDLLAVMTTNAGKKLPPLMFVSLLKQLRMETLSGRPAFGARRRVRAGGSPTTPA